MHQWLIHEYESAADPEDTAGASAEVWSDFDRAQEAVNREASALRAVVLLIANYRGEPETRMRVLVRRVATIAR
jgi:hypothetical protein